MIHVKHALLSVWDKTGILEFAKFLHERGILLYSTGGTYNYLKEHSLPVRSLQELTGFPEILDGRVKTLHPHIHAGILADMDKPEHRNTLERLQIPKIHLVVINLYPFVDTLLKYGNSQEEKHQKEIIENIDIGGPALIRASAKNYRHTVVVCDTADYRIIQEELEKNNGISTETSFRLAAKAFQITSTYDAAIAGYFGEVVKDEFPEYISLPLKRVTGLRYGENPHQKAYFYRPLIKTRKSQEPLGFHLHQGKELSFNNFLDVTSAMQCALSLPHHGVVIVKHANPSGAAFAKNESELVEAFLKARNCDPVSAFGGIIAINGTVDENLAKAITEQFVECVIARRYTGEALEVFGKKPAIRVLEHPEPEELLKPQKELRAAMDGYLLQDMDVVFNTREAWKVVTEKYPGEEDWEALEFAWRVVKYVKSNAIVFTSKDATLGIGAGQMSRVDAVELAILKAKKNGISLEGSYVASDAFFPFKDGVELIAGTGARGIIQPGGSLRDQEVIETANRYGLIMVFTAMRHFRH